MSTHQFNKEMLPDTAFVKGETKYLNIGNKGRLLDPRRTPGEIINIDMDGGYFEWKILDFEDKGKSWLVPFEQVESYQFHKEASSIPTQSITEIIKRSNELHSYIDIQADPSQVQSTTQKFKRFEEEAESWLLNKSAFVSSKNSIDFKSNKGPVELQSDFLTYAMELDFLAQEKKTAETQVMNPQSGDWIRGLQIVMAEMGIKPYKGLNFRSSNTFNGIGSKNLRADYILRRMSFLRAFFKLHNINEVTLYRGMATEWPWSSGERKHYKFWSSWTFDYKVAQDFCQLEPNTKFKNSYLIKKSLPVKNLFMTFLETAEKSLVDTRRLLAQSH